MKTANPAVGALLGTAGLGTLGYYSGKSMARKGEDPSIPLNLLGSLVLPPVLPYAAGKFIGHGRESSRLLREGTESKEAGAEVKTANTARVLADTAKQSLMPGLKQTLHSIPPPAPSAVMNAVRPVAQGSNVVKRQGFSRGLQLLSGSRARALESQAADRGKVLARNASTGDRVIRSAVFGDVGEGAAQNAIHMSERSIQGARRGMGRASREAVRERAAVSGARKDALKAVGGGVAGLGGAMALSGGDKTAGVTAGLASTVAAKSNKIREATQAIQKQVVKNNAPAISRNQKLVGGGLAVGAGTGLSMRGKSEKTAGLSIEREQQIKEAFGAALMQGIKGVGNFMGTAGKSIVNAGKAGGMQAAGRAAMNEGRAGMLRAGNFIAQNPGAGTAMVAAPALAAGYAAGRQ